jgi:uncharacterized membrane protein YjgN (DUF898 family)
MTIFTTPHHQFEFKGEGSKFFSIYIVNLLLMIVTLGFYYPWAKCSRLSYFYENTYFGGSNFKFTGTGKEMFRGFIKLVFILAIVLAIYAYFIYNQNPGIGLAILYFSLFGLAPLAIHGTYRYRLSRTSWRGIFFAYIGDLAELYAMYFTGIIFTILTIGIYGSWFTVKLRKFLIGNIRFGNLKFHYEGKGDELFVINIKGYILSVFTLGIFSFWWLKDRYNYYVNNIVIEDEEGNFHQVESNMTGGDFFELMVVNFFIILFTLGLGQPFAEVRMFKFLCSRLLVEQSLDLDKIGQVQQQYTDATADDLGDFLDIDIA